MPQASLFDPPRNPAPPDPEGYLHYVTEALETLLEDWEWEVVNDQLQKLRPTVAAESAPARWTDPETSHLAARREQDVGRFSNKSRQAKLLSIFATNDLTDQQATVRLVGSHAAPSAFDGCRRRCSDLRAVNYLYDTGGRRKNAGSDEESIVWGITAAGKAALRLLDTTGWSR